MPIYSKIGVELVPRFRSIPIITPILYLIARKEKLKDLTKYLHGVCKHPEKEDDYYKALQIPNLELPSETGK
jgi:hypothetical protein